MCVFVVDIGVESRIEGFVIMWWREWWRRMGFLDGRIERYLCPSDMMEVLHLRRLRENAVEGSKDTNKENFALAFFFFLALLTQAS